MLNALDTVIIIAYFAALSWIGFHFSKRQHSREEYFLAGRQMHWILVGGSLLATLVSSVTYLNTPGEMIRYGIGFFSSLLIVPLIAPVVNRFVVPVFARMPITSAYEYLEKRYGPGTRTLAALVFMVHTLVWMGLIIYSAAFAVAEMWGWNIYLTILIAGLATTAYTSAGGFRTVIWTDNLQLWILFAGALAIPAVVWISTGSGLVAWWNLFQQAGRAEVQFFSWDPTVRVTAVASMLNYFFWSVCTQSSDQVAVQRYLSTPSATFARRSVWMYAFFKITLTVCLLICGLALFAFYAGKSGLPVEAFARQIVTRADKIMPQFVAQEIPPGLSGLILAALMAAAMSSLSSGINSIASVYGVDLQPRLPGLRSWKHSVRTDKWVSFAAGAVSCVAATGVAWLVTRTHWNLVELTGRVNMIFVGAMGVLFFAGILFRRTGARAVLTGFFTAIAISLLIAFGKEMLRLERSFSFLWIIPASFLTGLGVSYLSGWVFAPPAAERVERLTLRASLHVH